MLVAGFVACVADMAVSIAGFITVEVVECLLIMLWHGTMIAMARIVAVVDMAVPSGAAVIPRTGTDEDSSGEPVGPVVTIGSAGVGRVVKVSVRAYGCGSDVDRDLCRSNGHAAHQCHSENRESKLLPSGHRDLLDSVS